MDPFEAPQTALPAVDADRFDIAGAMWGGLAALWRNLGATVVVLVLGMAAYLLSVCTLVGWIVILPALAWGIYAFILEAADGTAAVRTIYPAEGQFWHVVGQMWLLGVVFVVPVAILGMVPPFVWNYVRHGQLIVVGQPVENAIVSTVSSLVWAPLWCRFWFAPYAMVDRDHGALEALGLSWRLSRPVWLPLVGLWLATVILTSPFSVGLIGLQWLQDPANRSVLPPPADAWWVLQAAMWSTVLGSTLFAMGTQMMIATAYRQVTRSSPTDG